MTSSTDRQTPRPPDRAIVVLGLMGAGKTTTGQALADALRRELRDSDADIEARHGRTAAQIATEHGRKHLHELEARHLVDALAETPPPVIAAAASVVDRPDCRAGLREAFVVWLDAPPSELARRFDSGGHRPRYAEDLEQMLVEQDSRRRPHFVEVADVTVDVTRSSPDDIVRTVLATISRDVAGDSSHTRRR